jgi:Zn-dependent oligopeptidase
MHLKGEAKERFITIKKRISELCIQFQTNLNEDKTEVLFTKEELEGMGEDFLSGLPKRDDKYVVSLKYPELIPLMRNARREETRRVRPPCYSRCGRS